MPHIVKTRVRMMALSAVVITLLTLPGCLGGASVDDARAAQFEVAVSTWVVGIEDLRFELSSILNEESAFRSLSTVRDRVRALQAAIEPLGELDDDDANYLESKYGDELKALWKPYSAEAQRVLITGGIPTEISELLRGIPEFGPR